MVLHAYVGGGIQVGFVTNHHDLVRCVIVIAVGPPGHALEQGLEVPYLDHFAHTVLILDDGAQLHTGLQVALLLLTAFHGLLLAGVDLLTALIRSKQADLPSLVRELVVHDLGDVARVRDLVVGLVNVVVLLQQLLERLVGFQVVFFQA